MGDTMEHWSAPQWMQNGDDICNVYMNITATDIT